MFATICHSQRTTSGYNPWPGAASRALRGISRVSCISRVSWLAYFTHFTGFHQNRASHEILPFLAWSGFPRGDFLASLYRGKRTPYFIISWEKLFLQK